jgi:hypothetical protein
VHVAALASQCLALIMVLIPHIRAALAAHLQKHQSFLVELDRMRQVGWTLTCLDWASGASLTDVRARVQDYMEHHEKILAKFVSIMGELVHNSASSLEVRHTRVLAVFRLKDSIRMSGRWGWQRTDWDHMGSASCAFIDDVIKGVSAMHRVLHQHLPAPLVQVTDHGGRVSRVIMLA